MNNFVAIEIYFADFKLFGRLKFTLFDETFKEVILFSIELLLFACSFGGWLLSYVRLSSMSG